jgi:hypothetical protein
MDADLSPSRRGPHPGLVLRRRARRTRTRSLWASSPCREPPGGTRQRQRDGTFSNPALSPRWARCGENLALLSESPSRPLPRVCRETAGSRRHRGLWAMWDSDCSWGTWSRGAPSARGASGDHDGRRKPNRYTAPCEPLRAHSQEPSTLDARVPYPAQIPLRTLLPGNEAAEPKPSTPQPPPSPLSGRGREACTSGVPTCRRGLPRSAWARRSRGEPRSCSRLPRASHRDGRRA